MLLVSLILMLLNPPVWLLVVGWRVLPAPLIASEDFELAWSLSAKLAPGGAFTVEQRTFFADHLLTEMHDSESARWDPRRGMLLDVCVGLSSDVLYETEAFNAAVVLGHKHAELLDTIGVDIVNAAADNESSKLYDERSNYPRVLNYSTRHPYFLMRQVTLLPFLEQAGWNAGDDLPDSDQMMLEHRRLMPRTRALGTEASFDFDRFRDGLLADIAVRAGFASHHAHLYLPAHGQWADRAEFFDRAVGLSVILATDHTVDQEVIATLKRWAEKPESTECGFALFVVAQWARMPDLHQHSAELRDALFSDAIQALNHRTVLFTHDGEDFTVREAAQIAIVQLDPSGADSLPLVRAWMVEHGEFTMHAPYRHPDSDPALIASWAEHLSDLAWSDDIEIRRWLASTVPIRTGTPSDARIDEVIARLLIDEDEDIRWDAEYAAELRQEQRAKQTP
jgi:hypothetical protein